MQKVLKKYRYSLILLRELVITDFKLRYQNSALGYLWSLMKPLFLFAIMYVVFVKFLKIGAGIEHWPVAMLMGMVMWTFFQEITKGGLKAIVNRGDLLRKINFPKYIVILSGTASAFINLLLNMVVITVFMIANKVDLSSLALLSPLLVVELTLFGLGIAFFLSAVYVKLRDVEYIWDVVMQGLFYGSAIMFPISRISEVSVEFARVLLLNPIAQVISDLRYILTNQDMQTLTTLSDGKVWLALVPIAISIATFVFGAWYFRKKSPYFAEFA